MTGWRTRFRRVAAFLLVAASAVACTGLSPGSTEDGPRLDALSARIAEFVADWEAGRTHDAGELSTDPAATALLLTTIGTSLRAESVRIDAGVPRLEPDGAAIVDATLSWQLPIAGTWRYDTSWRWLPPRGDGDWLLRYEPTIVHARLGPQQTLAVRAVEGLPGTVVDRNDVELLRSQRVYSVVVLLDSVADGGVLAEALELALDPVDAGVTAESIVAGIARARAEESASYTVVNLRADEFAEVETALAALSAVATPSQLMSLPPTRGFAPTVIGQVRAAAETRTAGASGWRIVTVDAVGDELDVIAAAEPEPGAKVTVTLDPQVQMLAQRVLADIAEPAMLVALQPSTGEVLAVAQNDVADRHGPLALTGRYPPGSIFKIVTAAAALQEGDLTPASRVDCPGSWTAEFSTIRNQGFERGRVPLTDAFAHSCNTTFAMLAADLPAEALPEAASSFGIGLDFDVAGITTLTGAIQAGESRTARAENGFGQGTDLVTPFSAALMAATVAAGRMPLPVLLRGEVTGVDRPAPDLADDTAAGLKTLMRAVVTDGTARILRDAGTVYAKTGTAEYVADDGEIDAHAWTVGFRDDVAFAALIVGGETSGRTNEVVRDFLLGLDEHAAAADGAAADSDGADADETGPGR